MKSLKVLQIIRTLVNAQLREMADREETADISEKPTQEVFSQAELRNIAILHEIRAILVKKGINEN